MPSFIRTKNQDHAKQYTLNLDMSYDIEPHVKETWCTDFGMAHICTDICESILQKYHECAINEGVFVCKKEFKLQTSCNVLNAHKQIKLIIGTI